MTTQTAPDAELGDRVTVRCVTNYTQHTGSVVRVEPAAHYASGLVREWRVVIRDERTGREVIAWPGTVAR